MSCALLATRARCKSVCTSIIGHEPLSSRFVRSTRSRKYTAALSTEFLESLRSAVHSSSSRRPGFHTRSRCLGDTFVWRARRGGTRAGRARGQGGRAGECRTCRTPRPKCCPISRSEVDSLCTRTGPAAAERCGASVLVVNFSAGRRRLWSAIDGSRTNSRDRRRDGLGTFACAAALDRSAASAAPARARRPRIQPSAGAATAFDGARTSPPEQPA